MSRSDLQMDAPIPSHVPLKPSLWQKATSSKVLVISVLIHLIFAAVATYLIVQRVQLKRKMTFQGGPPAVNASKRALEHQMSLGKKKAVMSAPAQAKRIMSTGLAKVALPDLPSLPSATDAVPNRMGGIGGVGNSFGGGGGGGGLGGGGGSGINFFGLRSMVQNVVFIVDVSNSMVTGAKNPRTYATLEKEVERVVKSLDPQARFGLICFSADAVAYKNTLSSAMGFEKQRAMEWMKKQSPVEALDPKLKDKAHEDALHRHMGTNAGEALKRAFAMKPDTIFFISDGEPTGSSGNDVIKEVAELQKTLPRPAKIHVISYVPDEGQDFMQGLARANGGEYRLVNLNETGK